MKPRFDSLATLLRWAKQAPPSATLGVSDLVEVLEEVADMDAPEPAPRADPTAGRTWRERLWTVPGETRLGVHELCEALGKPRSWVYDLTSLKAIERIVVPLRCSKLDGTLQFRAGELRWWLSQNEESLIECPSESTDADRKGWVAWAPRRGCSTQHVFPLSLPVDDQPGEELYQRREHWLHSSQRNPTSLR